MTLGLQVRHPALFRHQRSQEISSRWCFFIVAFVYLRPIVFLGLWYSPFLLLPIIGGLTQAVMICYCHGSLWIRLHGRWKLTIKPTLLQLLRLYFYSMSPHIYLVILRESYYAALAHRHRDSMTSNEMTSVEGCQTSYPRLSASRLQRMTLSGDEYLVR